MWFKLFDEPGKYTDITTGDSKNLICAQSTVYTPDGDNVGWTEFATEDLAMAFFNIKKEDTRTLKETVNQLEKQQVEYRKQIDSLILQQLQ